MSRFYQSTISPLAQTFFVKRNMTQGASCLFLGEVDLYFNSKSTKSGVTLEIRSVVNGYPTSEVLPFARKRLSPEEIATSETGATATIFRFDNPVKLLVETEYALVVIPDANDPDYILYTAVVGETDLTNGQAITRDWGDGALFTSTNNSAWKPQQTEDLKFRLRRYEFTSDIGYVNLIPNDVEYFTISNTVNKFKNDEVAYIESGNSVSASLSGTSVNIGTNTPGFAEGDYILLERGSENFVSKIDSIVEAPSNTVVQMEGTAWTLTSATSGDPLTAKLAVAGIVTYYDKRTATELHLKESSARTGALFAANTTITGFTSGATATIDSIDNKEISYIQPSIFTNNGSKTATSIHSYDGTTFDQNLTTVDNNYLTGQQRYINSKSNDGGADNDFVVRVFMNNNGYTKSTPLVDHDLSILHAYSYDIDDTDESSSYVAKEVILQDDMAAAGLKVLLSAYRPIGTMIDVYARFKYITNQEQKSDWVLLENNSLNLYSNPADVYDYRDFVYDLDEDTYTTEFISFQIKIVLRHATTAELGNVDLVPTKNIFPHLNDYRAIALT